MQFQYVIKCLEECQVKLEDDLRWYQQKNRRGVRLPGEDRKKRIAELTRQREEVVLALQQIREGKLDASCTLHQTKQPKIQHFIVIDQDWSVLLKGHIDTQRQVTLTFRYDAPDDGQVSEQYSGFEVILQMIPPGVLPTIQFSSENKIKEFL